jgi:hypothetical protein
VIVVWQGGAFVAVKPEPVNGEQPRHHDWVADPGTAACTELPRFE